MSANEKRNHILCVAEKLFAQNGFNGTSVRDIAEEAHVNISMISYYFGSKEGLMQALFKERTAHIIPMLEEVVYSESLTPLQKLDFLVDDFVERSVKKIRFHKILVSEQMVEKNPVITELINQLRKKNTELIQHLIAEGQAKGFFKKEVDAVLLMYTMIGTVVQTFVNLDYYRDFLGYAHMEEKEVEAVVKQKLSTYIKDLFKSILSYEA
jgi:AcrR family transcriptional regulator